MKRWRSNRRRDQRLQPNLPGLLDPSVHPHQSALTPPSRALERARLRLIVVMFAFTLVYVGIAGRLADLALFNESPEMAVTRRATSGEMPMASRADITDRNGTVLATSLPTVSLCADAKRVLNVGEAIDKLTEELPDLDRERLEADLRSNKRCAVIRRHLTPRQYYAVNKLGIAGLEFSPDEARTYPAGRLTSHVLGYTDIDSKGIAGIEKNFNEALQQKPQPVALSLDLRLQTIMNRELQQGISEYHALGGVGMVMDAQTGEILAMVSLPDFDPQRPGDADDEAKFNRATLGVYEMGSTFKIFTTAMALDSGLVKMAERFDTTHPIQVGKKTIRDFHPSDHAMNVPEIFMESSNIGAARMAERVGGAKQRAFLQRLGLTEKLSLEIPEVGLPLVPDASSWGVATTLTVAFGHGVAVNAVQLLSAVAAIMNDGIPVRPTLLKVDAPRKEEGKDRVVSPKTAALMRALMRLVVTNGTAKSSEVEGYMVGGKTGTADKQSNGHYVKNARMSSFIGVFPIHAPRYVVFAMLDDPKGNAKTYGFATGGWTAAPIVGRVISQMGPLLDMPPLQEELIATTENRILRPLGNEVIKTLDLHKDSENYASVDSNPAE